MELISRIPIAEVAVAIADALGEVLDRGVALVPGAVVPGKPRADVLPADDAHTVVLPFRGGIVGEVTLVVGEPLATAMEAATPGASLTTAVLPALTVGAAAIALATNLRIDTEDASEIATETLTGVVGDFAAVPLLQDGTPVACVVVRVVDEASPDSAVERARPADDPQFTGLGRHEFPALGAAGTAATPARPLSVLNDVAMEVTAELGRRRLKVRDIAALQPGSVLALDRAAGSPVDLRVNGALVLRGEVVVVDDDLGVRVGEVVVDESSSMPRAR
jgi:flagellar motor switch protein FliN/FliY